ncbi:uncharacterized protein EHS24_000699 [Apiotrichum porosum]|uniref:Uncharacterized protein n=1 Tax=Apiotrichum porosum TaxID=105984 RepID=A0A427YAI7_9TREE|nr:uncharacterized protein EHS24_000699 [Apiotrichum porosum]RSH88171.1 hypothetical protein EHS24_000699 [Apiotrichum porosum]
MAHGSANLGARNGGARRTRQVSLPTTPAVVQASMPILSSSAPSPFCNSVIYLHSRHINHPPFAGGKDEPALSPSARHWPLAPPSEGIVTHSTERGQVSDHGRGLGPVAPVAVAPLTALEHSRDSRSQHCWLGCSDSEPSSTRANGPMTLDELGMSDTYRAHGTAVRV